MDSNLKDKRLNEMKDNYNRACKKLKELVFSGKVDKDTAQIQQFEFLEEYRRLSHLFVNAKSIGTLKTRGSFE